MPRLNLDKATRDTLMFFGGLAGVIFETLHEHIDRPYLLAVFGTMMGLPLFVRKDEHDHDGEPDKKDER